jgi:hypothetical protein
MRDIAYQDLMKSDCLHNQDLGPSRMAGVNDSLRLSAIAYKSLYQRIESRCRPYRKLVKECGTNRVVGRPRPTNPTTKCGITQPCRDHKPPHASIVHETPSRSECLSSHQGKPPYPLTSAGRLPPLSRKDLCKCHSADISQSSKAIINLH